MGDPTKQTAIYAVLMFGIVAPSVIVTTLYAINDDPSASPVVCGAGVLLALFCAIIGSNIILDSDEDE